jgi:hypothetical protein
VFATRNAKSRHVDVQLTSTVALNETFTGMVFIFSNDSGGVLICIAGNPRSVTAPAVFQKKGCRAGQSSAQIRRQRTHSSRFDVGSPASSSCENSEFRGCVPLHQRRLPTLRRSTFVLRDATTARENSATKIRRQFTYYSSFGCSLGGRFALRAGARRAMARPRMRSRPLMKSSLPSGRPVVSLVRKGAKRVSSYACGASSSAKRGTSASSGPTVTSSSSRRAKCARTLHHGQSSARENSATVYSLQQLWLLARRQVRFASRCATPRQRSPERARDLWFAG